MIEACSFGKMVVNGISYGNDLLVIHGEVQEDWRRKTGHLVDMDDARALLGSAPDILVLGTGRSGMMKIDPSLQTVLEEKGIELIAQPTTEAVRTFNQLWQKGRNVAAGFHLTC
jgi:hypothetical protein